MKQNVGTPKFYIDYLSYWQLKGRVVGVGHPVPGEGFDGEWGETVIVDDVVQSLAGHWAGAVGHRPSLIGLNPRDFILEDFSYIPHKYITVTLDSEEPLPDVPSTGDSHYWFGVLNHSLYSSNTRISGFNLDDDTFFGSSGEYDEDDWEEIVNMQIDGYDRCKYNGFSLAKLTAESSPTSGGGIANITYKFDLRPALFNNTLELKESLLGSLGFGVAYQLPQSPELSLTLIREYEGTKTQETKGGTTLTQVNYDGPPSWGPWGPWALGQDAPLPDQVSGLNPKDISRGRRTWQLKFSHMSTSDLFPVNEMYNRNTGNFFDSETSDYSADDFDDDNAVAFNKSGVSFMQTVVGMTMGGAIPFIFQPNSNDNTPQGFAICTFDSDTLKLKQVAPNVYDIALKIREVW